MAYVAAVLGGALVAMLAVVGAVLARRVRRGGNPVMPDLPPAYDPNVSAALLAAQAEAEAKHRTEAARGLQEAIRRATRG